MTDVKNFWNGYLGWAKFFLTVILAFVHATFVVAGIYIAINSRLTTLEVKMDIVWAQVKKVLDRVDR